MEEEEGGGGGRLGKKERGEVEYKKKSGTAWSHSYLNQKPWHPLSYPNQRRKWIAEQTHAHRQLRSLEVAREFSQEQEFFRQTALISKKDKQKVETMKALSFMYVRPPGYNPDPPKPADESHKPRPKDVFGRALPTQDEFQVLQNAPRMETGVPARVKPFGIEIRNVKCVRCGNFGHQSGDRECPLKDAIMPNEESRLKRDDPLTTILAHTAAIEPLKWELKQKPGMSPVRGGFEPDDPNQQIVAEDDIFDEYGGFLSGGNIPELLTNFPTSKNKSTAKSKGRHEKDKKQKKKKKKKSYSESSSSSSETAEDDSRRRHHKRSRRGRDSSSSPPDSYSDRSRRHRHGHSDDSLAE